MKKEEKRVEVEAEVKYYEAVDNILDYIRC